MNAERISGPLTVVAATGTVAVAGSYAVTGGSDVFAAAPVSRFVVRTAPAWLTTFSITQLGFLGDALVAATALVVAALLLGLVATAGLVVTARIDRVQGAFAVGGLAVGTVVWLSTGSALSAGAAAFPVAAILVFVQHPESGRAALDPSRRRTLRLAALGLGFAGLAALLGRQFEARAQTKPLGVDVSRERQAAADVALPSSDLVPPLVSANADFYTVDIDVSNPAVAASDWAFTVDGDTESTVTVDYEDLRNESPTSVYDTLRCVSDPVGGDLIDNALWTGVPLAALVERARPHDDATRVVVSAADGYEVAFPRAALTDAFLAYGMNGAPLPRGHGHPVRLLVPGHWGETNVKWATGLRFTTERVQGYWEKRGWHGTGPVEPVAKIRGSHVDGNSVTLGGVTYAGVHGVARVQVSTDGGDSWTDATLSKRLPDKLVLANDVWRQWTYQWTAASGTHDVLARVVTDDGTVQSARGAQPFPSGASGYDHQEIEV